MVDFPRPHCSGFFCCARVAALKLGVKGSAGRSSPSQPFICLLLLPNHHSSPAFLFFSTCPIAVGAHSFIKLLTQSSSITSTVIHLDRSVPSTLINLNLSSTRPIFSKGEKKRTHYLAELLLSDLSILPLARICFRDKYPTTNSHSNS